MYVGLVSRVLLLLACMFLVADCLKVFNFPNSRIRPITYKRKQSIEANKKPRHVREAVGPLWRVKRIPYAFSETVNEISRGNIFLALYEMKQSLKLNEKTCIEFIDFKDSFYISFNRKEDELKDYINFIDEGVCDSEIGYTPGANPISLTEECTYSKANVIQKVMHRLGFENEHDEKIGSMTNKIESKINIDAPYDFTSVVYYGENEFLSKYPFLLKKARYSSLNNYKLSPIDIYKLQKMFRCDTLPIPGEGMSESVEESRLVKIVERFKTETVLDSSINQTLVDIYLEKTHQLCGLDRVWPLEYPIVESNHKLYKFLCVQKKEKWSKCHYSIECDNEEAVCEFGKCINPQNRILSDVMQVLHDKGRLIVYKIKTAMKVLFGSKQNYSV